MESIVSFGKDTKMFWFYLSNLFYSSLILVGIVLIVNGVSSLMGFPVIRIILPDAQERNQKMPPDAQERVQVVDIWWFRNNPDALREQLKNKGADTTLVDNIIEMDNQWRKLDTMKEYKYRLLNLLKKFMSWSEEQRLQKKDYVLMTLNKINVDAKTMVDTDFYSMSNKSLKEYKKSLVNNILEHKAIVMPLENKIIDKLNMFGNIVNDCKNYNSRLNRKYFNRPY